MHQQLKADERDFALAKRLDAIRQNADLVVEGKYDPHRAAAEYQETFREAGYDVESGDVDSGDVEAVAERIRQSPIRYALVAALDDWALARFRLGAARCASR